MAPPGGPGWGAAGPSNFGTSAPSIVNRRIISTIIAIVLALVLFVVRLWIRGYF
jgi:hypothetical protein